MTQLTSCSINRIDGEEGSRHDPYSYTSRIFERNGKVIVLHTGIGVSLTEFNGTRKAAQGENIEAEEQTLIKEFEHTIGMSVKLFDKIYDRLHPYFEDPMGGPGMYV